MGYDMEFNLNEDLDNVNKWLIPNKLTPRPVLDVELFMYMCRT